MNIKGDFKKTMKTVRYLFNSPERIIIGDRAWHSPVWLGINSLGWDVNAPLKQTVFYWMAEWGIDPSENPGNKKLLVYDGLTAYSNEHLQPDPKMSTVIRRWDVG